MHGDVAGLEDISYFFFLSVRTCKMNRILQSDCFRQRAEFSDLADLSAGNGTNHVQCSTRAL